MASWAGLCPGNNVTAGKRLSGRTRKGNRFLRATLTECAWAVRRTDAFHARVFARLEAKIGGKKGRCCSRAQLVVAYHILASGGVYDEGRYAASASKEAARRLNRALRTIRRLGHEVVLKPAKAVQSTDCLPTAAAPEEVAPPTPLRDLTCKVEVRIDGALLSRHRAGTP